MLVSTIDFYSIYRLQASPITSRLWLPTITITETFNTYDWKEHPKKAKKQKQRHL
jgi:hypothetical protein